MVFSHLKPSLLFSIIEKEILKNNQLKRKPKSNIEPIITITTTNEITYNYLDNPNKGWKVHTKRANWHTKAG